jgi:hypothetical protein
MEVRQRGTALIPPNFCDLGSEKGTFIFSAQPSDTSIVNFGCGKDECPLFAPLVLGQRTGGQAASGTHASRAALDGSGEPSYNATFSCDTIRAGHSRAVSV